MCVYVCVCVCTCIRACILLIFSNVVVFLLFVLLPCYNSTQLDLDKNSNGANTINGLYVCTRTYNTKF